MPLVFPAVFAFIGALITRIFNWFLVALLSGAMKAAALYGLLVAAVAGVIFGLVIFVNDLIMSYVNTLGPLGKGILLGIAAMMPSSMPYLVTAILTYYAFSISAHIALEIAKLKVVWAEKALQYFKA